MNHHNHPSHTHNFFNKHTSWAILILVVGAFLAGYYVARHLVFSDYYNSDHMRDSRYTGRQHTGGMDKYR